MIVHSAEVTRDSLREEIASLPDACEVIAMMAARGWGVSTEIRDYERPRRLLAKFTRWSWCGVPLGVSLGYGFMTPALDALENGMQSFEIDLAIRKAAELALRVEETFIDVLPRASGSQSGVIEPDLPSFQTQFQESLARFRDPSFVASRHDRLDNRVFQDPDDGPLLTVDRDFFLMYLKGREILLTDNDIDRLERGIENFRMKKNGKLCM